MAPIHSPASAVSNRVAMHWIDGQWADSDQHRESVNPATGEVIGTYAMASAEDAQRAIDAARATAHARRCPRAGHELKRPGAQKSAIVAAMNESQPNVAEFTVSELSAALKRTVEDNFGYVRVRGEISGYKGPHSSGHVYFALKDQTAKIDGVIWKGVFGRMRCDCVLPTK